MRNMNNERLTKIWSMDIAAGVSQFGEERSIPKGVPYEIKYRDKKQFQIN